MTSTQRVKSSQPNLHTRERLNYFPVSSLCDLCEVSRESKSSKHSNTECFLDSFKIKIIKKVSRFTLPFTVSNSYMEHKLANNISNNFEFSKGFHKH